MTARATNPNQHPEKGRNTMSKKPTLDPIFTAPTWPGVKPMTSHNRTLRGDNPALAKALHEIPGFTEANAALHAFAKEAAALTADPVPTGDDRAAALAARFLSGDRPEAAILRDEIAEDAAQALAAEGAGAVVSGTGMRLLYAREEIVTNGHDEIAASLTRQFRAIIDKARTAGVNTATLDEAAVLRRKAQREFDALDEATEAYIELRAAGTAFLNDYRQTFGQTDATTSDYWTAATLVDPLGVDRWYPATSGPYQVWNKATGEVVREPLLPDFAHGESREIVAWLAEHDEADVWVPTGPQASKAVQALSKARSEAAAAATRRIPLSVQRGVFGQVELVKWGTAEATGWRVTSAIGDDADVWVVQRMPEALVIG